MHFFLTGILGHACPHLARLLLQDGHEVHALIRGSNGNQYDLLDVLTTQEIESITFHYGDLKDYLSLDRIFKNNKFDGCFHLGAQSHPPTAFIDPIGTMQTNVKGTVNLVEAIIKNNPACVLCNVSTSEVYGDECKHIGILTEDIDLKPSNPYGWSKMCAERYVTERCRNGFLKGFNTRAFSHLAPRRGKNFSISWDAFHLAQMKARLYKVGHQHLGELILPVGNLTTQRIVIDARDVMKAYYLLMLHFNCKFNGESFNVCGAMEDVKKMEYFTDKLIQISGLQGVKKVIDKRVYRDVDIQIQVGCTKKLKSTINWKPEIPIEQTLKDVYKYWLKKLS